ncbi:uncharacterized protein LOC143433668 [Xylocopa sonorina]|uniref:uncharacterized protein LOC143433668 n=1 Tax=Xylocopa sonorina TaxID=1818115 RepID=UPI00403ABEBA
MFDDCMAIIKMNNNNSSRSKEDYAVCNGELNPKCFITWSPMGRNKFSLKHKYVTCKSAPNRNKRFVRFRISRSLNFDASVHSSSSETSPYEEDKHLSRSAKIMRALHFNNSPSYYGKTKIKKSLNFNSTPSPKRFIPAKKNIRKSLSLNFSPPLSVSNKFINFDDNPSDSVNNSILFSSSDSIDENQNETPSQQSTKEHEILHYSTPNAKLTRKSLRLAGFTPLMRSRLKETVDNIVYSTATPNSHSLKRISRLNCTNNISMNTSRNLYHEFYDKDDNRPCTPENVISIVPESMSAIKRSHKKERSSKRSERCIVECTNNFVDNKSILQNRTKVLLNKQTTSHTEDDMSDTGSLFDYSEEQKSSLDESKEIIDYTSNSNIVSEIDETDVKVKSEENMECFLENELLHDRSDVNTNDSSSENVNLPDARSVTPEPVTNVKLELQKPVTPENRINILEKIANDSIKRSHKKIKDDKRRLFSPKILQGRLEVAEQHLQNMKCWQNIEQHENNEENKIEQDNLNASREDRSSTPEKINSSRLLLSQFSSVKKSHKKDKHNKILSGFLKRQEYFNKDMDLATNSKYKTFDDDGVSESKSSTEDFSLDLGVSTNIDDSTPLIGYMGTNSSLEKLSPSKRKKLLNVSYDGETSASYDSELQESDVSKEEFQIFSPLKRKRSLITSTVYKEYLHSYDLSSEKNEFFEDSVANANFSRCLTPVPSFSGNCVNIEVNNETAIKSGSNVNNESAEEIENCISNDVTGRLTPRNMSTAELYCNLDSIKKSHKKNKRGNISRKGINLVTNNCYVDEQSDRTSIENIESGMYNTLDHSSECVVIDDMINKSMTNKSVDHDDAEASTSFAIDNENYPSTSTENQSSTVTPPNCLKTKSYIRLIQETSIKRSHKKVRDQRRQELKVDTIELSDDGSIFDDEEKLAFTED